MCYPLTLGQPTAVLRGTVRPSPMVSHMDPRTLKCFTLLLDMLYSLKKMLWVGEIFLLEKYLQSEVRNKKPESHAYGQVLISLVHL